jgi:hypothetical protein
MKSLQTLQFISMLLSVLSALFILGAEPSTITESSLYEYDNFMRHTMHFLVAVLGLSVITFIVTELIMRRAK